jgi:predicted AAA+ superfamily ATPase
MLLKRHLAKIIKKVKKSVLLLGPRQAGKSTLIQSLMPDLTINLADEETFVQFLRDPGALRSRLLANTKIFIDEVQRIPSILNTVQSLIDNDRSLQFYLTGSSARKLKRGKANLLPGRIVTFELGPLCLSELGDLFEIDKALTRGLLPGIYTEEDGSIVTKLLRSYAQTYLREEIQAEALTRNLEGFSRFFSVVISRAGDTLDFTKIAKEAAIERMSARRYYDILVDTLVANEVPAYSQSNRTRLIQHPKFYLFDVGVLNGCLGNFNVSNDRVGKIFEHLVLQIILSEAKSRDQEIRVSTYRTEAGAEVDFIVETENKLFAVEVKASKNVHTGDLTGLKSFANFTKKQKQLMVIYQGSVEKEIDTVQVLPLASALKYMGFAPPE